MSKDKAGNKLFQLVVRVSRAEGSAIPQGASDAVAPCFVFASDYGEAARRCVAELSRRRLVCEEIAPKVVEIATARWDAHVAETFADVARHLPDQAAVEAMAAEEGAIFFGPFAGFER